MKSRILVAVLLVPLLLAVMLFTPAGCFAIVVAVISSMAAYELITSTNMNAGKWTTICGVISAAAIPLCMGLGIDLVEEIAYGLVVLLFIKAIASYKTEHEVSFSCIVMVVFGGVIIPMLLTSLVQLRIMNKLYSLIPFVIAFLSDAGAYFVGIAIGKHKLIPRVSPKKTIEGSVGGFAFTILFMVIYCAVLSRFSCVDVNYGVAVIYAVLGSAVTQIGDLAFSLVKRQFEIKDFGTILGEHGGMLDRFDSMIFVAPLVFVLIKWLPVF